MQDQVRELRLKNNPMGLANSLRGMGTGTQPALWGALAGLTMPVLLMAGAQDTKFVHIAHEMAKEMPSATLEIVADAGHTIHLEQPVRYAALIFQSPHNAQVDG